MKKKYILIILSLIFFANIYSQETEYLIVEKLKNRITANVYEIKKTSIEANRYENKEIDNPEYLLIQKQIDTLDNQIKILNGGTFSGQQISNLKNAKKYLKDAISYYNYDKSKTWNQIKKAKDELDKTNIDFVQRTKNKYSLAIKEAEENIVKIDDILGNTPEKEDKIRSIYLEIRKLKNKIGSNGRIGYSSENRIKKTVMKDIVIGNIKRNILLLDTINIFSKITGKYKYADLNAYKLNRDFKSFKNGEIISKKNSI